MWAQNKKVLTFKDNRHIRSICQNVIAKSPEKGGYNKINISILVLFQVEGTELEA